MPLLWRLTIGLLLLRFAFFFYIWENTVGYILFALLIIVAFIKLIHAWKNLLYWISPESQGNNRIIQKVLSIAVCVVTSVLIGIMKIDGGRFAGYEYADASFGQVVLSLLVILGGFFVSIVLVLCGSFVLLGLINGKIIK